VTIYYVNDAVQQRAVVIPSGVEGNVTLSPSASLRMNGVEGNVTLSGVEGNVTLSGVEGNVTLSGVEG
jgi:hypothetical protein